MFSATVRFGNRLKSWKITLIPAAAAELGVIRPCASPPKRMTPSSWRSTPTSTLMSVDLPDPFSPARHTASPGAIAMSTPSSAVIAA